MSFDEHLENRLSAWELAAHQHHERNIWPDSANTVKAVHGSGHQETLTHYIPKTAEERRKSWLRRVREEPAIQREREEEREHAEREKTISWSDRAHRELVGNIKSEAPHYIRQWRWKTTVASATLYMPLLKRWSEETGVVAPDLVLRSNPIGSTLKSAFTLQGVMADYPMIYLAVGRYPKQKLTVAKLAELSHEFGHLRHHYPDSLRLMKAGVRPTVASESVGVREFPTSPERVRRLSVFGVPPKLKTRQEHAAWFFGKQVASPLLTPEGMRHYRWLKHFAMMSHKQKVHFPHSRKHFETERQRKEFDRLRKIVWAAEEQTEGIR
jgi:hypothetical protein